MMFHASGLGATDDSCKWYEGPGPGGVCKFYPGGILYKVFMLPARLVGIKSQPGGWDLVGPGGLVSAAAWLLILYQFGGRK